MARGEDAIKGLRPHICSPLGCWNLGGQGSTVSKHKHIIKMRGKTTDSFGSNFIWLKIEKCFLEKWQGFDVKMHQNRQTSIKTSELEDRYAVIFSLALWPEEPREIDFFKKSWFSKKKCRPKNVKIELKWVPVAPFGLIFSQNRSQCIQEAF